MKEKQTQIRKILNSWSDLTSKNLLEGLMLKQYLRNRSGQMIQHHNLNQWTAITHNEPQSKGLLVHVYLDLNPKEVLSGHWRGSYFRPTLERIQSGNFSLSFEEKRNLADCLMFCHPPVFPVLFAHGRTPEAEAFNTINLVHAIDDVKTWDRLRRFSETKNMTDLSDDAWTIGALLTSQELIETPKSPPDWKPYNRLEFYRLGLKAPLPRHLNPILFRWNNLVPELRWNEEMYGEFFNPKLGYFCVENIDIPKYRDLNPLMEPRPECVIS